MQLPRLIRALWTVTLGRRRKLPSKRTNRIEVLAWMESLATKRGGLRQAPRERRSPLFRDLRRSDSSRRHATVVSDEWRKRDSDSLTIFCVGEDIRQWQQEEPEGCRKNNAGFISEKLRSLKHCHVKFLVFVYAKSWPENSSRF